MNSDNGDLRTYKNKSLEEIKEKGSGDYWCIDGDKIYVGSDTFIKR